MLRSTWNDILSIPNSMEVNNIQYQISPLRNKAVTTVWSGRRDVEIRAVGDDFGVFCIYTVILSITISVSRNIVT